MYLHYIFSHLSYGNIYLLNTINCEIFFYSFDIERNNYQGRFHPLLTVQAICCLTERHKQDFFIAEPSGLKPRVCMRRNSYSFVHVISSLHNRKHVFKYLHKIINGTVIIVL